MATNTIPPHPEKESRRVVSVAVVPLRSGLLRVLRRAFRVTFSPSPSLSLCRALETVGCLQGTFPLYVCAVMLLLLMLMILGFTEFSSPVHRAIHTHTHFHRQTNDVSAATHPRISSDPIDPNECMKIKKKRKTQRSRCSFTPENGSPNPKPNTIQLA